LNATSLLPWAEHDVSQREINMFDKHRYLFPIMNPIYPGCPG
jgi:hypothetical protein